MVDAEAEAYGQARQLFEALGPRADFLLYSAADSAQFHVQVRDFAVATHRLFNWIDQKI